MRVISVILCLILSTSVPAYAGSILWSSKHVITNLAKDEEWLLSATTEDGEDIDDVEATASDIEDSEADSEADPEADPEDSVEYIDATLVMEGTEAVPLEITMDPTTPNDIQEYEAPEDGVDEDVEHTASEDGVDEVEDLNEPQTNP